MRQAVLTDVSVRNAKAGEKIRKLSDSHGLQMWVMPSGSKLWRYAFRFDGKQKVLALGTYPTVSLLEARKRRDLAVEQRFSGEDPSHVRKVERLTKDVRRGNTFRIVAEEWITKNEREGRASSTISKVRWLLDFAYPLLGDRPIAAVSAQEILVALQKVEARGTLETARRMRSTIGAVFRYAVATARAETDPTFALRGALIAPKVTHRAAITDAKKVGELLRAIDGFEGRPSTKAALAIAPHIFVRPGELRKMEWTEVNFEDSVWILPADKTKMRRPHAVPLSTQAQAILRDLHRISGDGKLAFPCNRSAHRPLSDNSMNAALRRLGYSKEEMSPHGFRALASSLLNESGLWHPDAIERQLGHVESDNVRRAYARGEHWAERVRMMQWWSNFLDDLKSKRSPQ